MQQRTLFFTGIFLALYFLQPYIILSQNNLAGRVIAASEQSPISGARIFLAGTIIGDISSNQGKFILKNIPEGTYQLVVTSLGYKPYKRSITISETTTDSIFVSHWI